MLPTAIQQPLKRLKGFARKRLSDAEYTVLELGGKVRSHHFRRALLRSYGAKIDSSAAIYHGVQVRRAEALQIGANTSIGEDAILDARGGLVIGQRVNFSSQVHVWTVQHDWRAAAFDYVKRGVTIDDYVWVGPRVTILPGCHIGEGAVIAANAVVSGDVEPYTLVGGVPAKKIGDRPRGLDYLPAGRGRVTWWW